MNRDDIANAIQPGHFGMFAFATDAAGACVHLGTEQAPNACRIYPFRGTTCRSFEKGSRQCLEYRKEFHIGQGRQTDVRFDPEPL
ncbi:MAG: hypothetical protein AAF550_02910 [Myxococcota bacterium]